MTCVRFTPCPGKTIKDLLLSNLLNIEEKTSFHITPVSIPRKVPFARNKNSNVFDKFVKSKMTCITFTPCPGKTIKQVTLVKFTVDRRNNELLDETSLDSK